VSVDLETGAGFLAAGTWSSSAKSLADMLTTPDSLAGLLYLGEWARLTSGLSALLGIGGKTRGDGDGFDGTCPHSTYVNSDEADSQNNIHEHVVTRQCTFLRSAFIIQIHSQQMSHAHWSLILVLVLLNFFYYGSVFSIRLHAVLSGESRGFIGFRQPIPPPWCLPSLHKTTINSSKLAKYCFAFFQNTSM